MFTFRFLLTKSQGQRTGYIDTFRSDYVFTSEEQQDEMKKKCAEGGFHSHCLNTTSRRGRKGLLRVSMFEPECTIAESKAYC